MGLRIVGPRRGDQRAVNHHPEHTDDEQRSDSQQSHDSLGHCMGRQDKETETEGEAEFCHVLSRN
jgi:hypothetical protein